MKQVFIIAYCLWVLYVLFSVRNTITWNVSEIIGLLVALSLGLVITVLGQKIVQRIARWDSVKEEQND